MRRHFKPYLMATTLLAILLIVRSVRAADTYPPPPAHYFNDYAHVVSQATADRLNRQLQQFEKETSNQLVVAIFPKLQSDSSVDDYCIHLFQAWKIGQKNKDNGVGLFVFVQDHKLFISTGYGLEGALPDATCHQIIANDITPRFKAGDYDGGLTAGVNAIISATKGEYKGTGATVGDSDSPVRAIPAWIIIALVILYILYGMFYRRGPTIYSNRGSWGGGGFGGFGGGGFGGGGFGGGGGGFSGGGGSTGGGGAGGSW